MLKVGLTGGYASGKTLIARHLESLGCFIIYADQLGHQVLLPDGEAYQPAVDLFGPSILSADRTIHRKKLGAIVFQNPALLTQLNQIVHPAVFRLEKEAIAGFERLNAEGIVIVEAAILIETGRYKTLDRLVVTTCDREIQIERAMKRDAISRDEAEARIARQLTDSKRLSFADYVIDTGGPEAETLRQVNELHAQLKTSTIPLSA